MVLVNLPAGKRLWVDATAPAYPVGVLPLAVRDQRVLVIAPGTRELMSTPGRAETPAQLEEGVDIQLAPFADGSARVTLAQGGAFEGAARAAAGECQPAEAHKLAEDLVQTLFGKDPFTATVTGCKSGEGPVTTVAEIPRASGVDTGDEVATLLLPSRTLDWVVPEGLRGRPPGTDERNEAQKDDERRQLRERTGLTEEQLEQRAYSFDFRPRVERTYRIHLPPRFVVGSLPSNRTLKLGPATWTETFTSTDARTVEARFRFETEQVEWSVDDVKGFRAAYWKRFSENKPQVVAKFEPSWLMEEKHAGQAMALARTWLAEQPNDGPTRARVARVLLGLGLGDLARQEAERALQSSPEDPLVLMVRGEVARYDANGLRYQPGFERTQALECLRKAHRLMPHHTWAAATLADVLERNEAGEEVSSWTPEVEEAAQVLQHMVDANEATDEMVNTLSGIYLRARRPEPLKKLFEQRPGLRDESNMTMSLIHQVLSSGLDGALRRVERVPDPKERFTALVLAYSTLVQMNRFDDATTLLQRFTPGDALAREMEGLRAMNQGLGPVPSELNLSAPEAAARSVFAIFANMGAPAEASRRLASLASPTGRSELDGTSHVFSFVRLPNLSTPFGYLELYHRGQCVSTEGGVAVRVRCDVAENRALNATSYWVRDGKDLKLESLGRPSQLAGRAWTQAKAGHLDESGAWIRWLIDELGVRQVETGAATLLKEYWTQAKHTDPAAVLFAAAVAQVTFRDMVKDAPPSVIQALRQGIPTLAGALRRRAQLVLVDALDIREDYRGAVHALEPVAQSENEPWMWLRLATLESHLDTARALGRIDKALKKDPTDVDWRKVKADVCLRAGRYGEALDTLTALEAEKGSSKGLENNLLWARLMAGRLDADSERDAARMGSEKSVSSAELHTAALILLERGRAADGAQLATQRLRGLGLESDPAQALLRARLLQLLGYDEPARTLYAKVGNDDPELSDLRRRFLAPGAKPAASPATGKRQARDVR
jgi:tetratricopeptide (TPR) repeat protein